MRNLYKRAAALAVIAFSAQVTFAQAADGTVTFMGQISNNTCTLAMSDGTTTVTNGGNLSVDFGRISIPATAPAIGGALGTEKTVTFTTRNAAGTAACAASSTTGDKVAFNVLLGLTSSQIRTISGVTYRANDILPANGGTDAVLKLSSSTATLALTAQSGETGTFVSSTSGAIATGSLTLKAQLSASAAAIPTSGAFTAAIPVFLVYQ